jgi:predicted DNA-binding protein (MmcQ/YjbR family)
MNRKEFDRLVFEKYSVEADYPWGDSSEAVYRHTSNRKWFAIVLNVKKSKLVPFEELKQDKTESDTQESCFSSFMKKKCSKTKPSTKDETIDVVNLKCPEEVFETVWLDPNVYPAYHMNKRHWISVPLDHNVSDETIEYLLQKSFDATEYKVRKKPAKEE